VSEDACVSDDRPVLKERQPAPFDRNRDPLIAFGQDIFGHAELGFREERTATLVADHLRRLRLGPQQGLALTGVKARLKGTRPGPTVRVMGDLAYWPPGHAVCILWGPTPASTGQEPRAASPVNVFGHITENAAEFGCVTSGAGQARTCLSPQDRGG
jgi:hypothetical protein